MSYEMFKEEFEGLGEIRDSGLYYFVLSQDIKIAYDKSMDEYLIYKSGELLDFGLDMKTAKLILKVLQ